jgi:hypothetical protein
MYYRSLIIAACVKKTEKNPERCSSFCVFSLLFVHHRQALSRSLAADVRRAMNPSTKTQEGNDHDNEAEL